MRKRQKLQKHSYGLYAHDKQFQENEPVLGKNFGQGPLWITGKILMKSGATIFLVELPDGQVIHRHTDQLKHNSLDPKISLKLDADEQWLLPDADSNQLDQERTEHRAFHLNEASTCTFFTQQSLIIVFVLGGRNVVCVIVK